MIDRDMVIALAEKHATCTSLQHKEFLHDDLLAFVREISQMTAEAEREACELACEQFVDFESMECAQSIRARGTGGEG